MKHFSSIILVLLAVLTVNIYAQNNNQNVPNIKPTVTAGDLVFVAQTLNTVELRGNEVETFVAVKNAIKPYLDKIQNDKLQANSNLELNLPLTTAQNLITFLERAKISGAEAERYKRFVDSFINAAKAASQQK
jgi:hypothetical protein